MSIITIIGAGWLGRPLAVHLKEEHTVFASKTHHKNSLLLIHDNIHAFVYDFNRNDYILSDILKKQKSNIVIGCFPPGFKKGNGQNYASFWKQLCEACIDANIKMLIMISSTAVYPNQAKDMNEECASLHLSMIDSTFSDKSKILLDAENYVIQSGLPYGILRMSGLIGPNRHPATFVKRIKQLSTQAPANILHQTDAINSIAFTIKNIKNDIINVTTPHTISKAEFYQYAVSLADTSTAFPKIIDEPDKRIIGEKLEKLGFQFTYKTPYAAVDNIEISL